VLIHGRTLSSSTWRPSPSAFVSLLGSYGGGNHFGECELIKVQDSERARSAAKVFGLRDKHVAFLSHCGSRGWGVLLAEGQFKSMQKKFAEWGIPLPGSDRHMMHAPLGSPGADAYLDDMALGADFATVNHMLINALVPLLVRAGANVSERLERHGFYPAGGGRVVVEIEPTRNAKPLQLLERGARLSAHAVATVACLSPSIAPREIEVLRDRLGLTEQETRIVEIPNPIGPGNAATVEIRYEHITEVFSGVGEVGRSAEAVARAIADDARDYIASEKPVGSYLADQLMVPLAMLAGGRYATGPLSNHARTNLEIVRVFGGKVSVDESDTVHVGRMLPS